MYLTLSCEDCNSRTLMSISPKNILILKNIFSVETQHTIGYGGRQTTEECPEAIFIMSVQENVTSGVTTYIYLVTLLPHVCLHTFLVISILTFLRQVSAGKCQDSSISAQVNIDVTFSLSSPSLES